MTEFTDTLSLKNCHKVPVRLDRTATREKVNMVGADRQAAEN